MIKLYHGSNVKIDKVDLSLGNKGKDFGQGFYLNPDFGQALSMAQRVTRTRSVGQATVSVFEFDENNLKSENLCVKVFDDYSEEWASFILSNRVNEGNGSVHPYDIVVGPIADDTVGVQLRRYIMGYIPIEKLIEELRFRGNRATQYFFGTYKAVSLLKIIGYEQ